MKKSQNSQFAPKSEDSITRENIDAVARIEQEAKAGLTLSDRVAEAIADFAGSMTFVWFHVAWFTTWILLNSIFGFDFDPYPFTFLTFVVSLEAIFLSTFILTTQNRQTEISERRNSLDLQVNLLSEQENTKMLYLLEKIADQVGIDRDTAPFKEDLTEKTDPSKIMEQLADVHGPVGKKDK